jgi:DNA (cytosine-5)-methyltransferase 1
MNLFDWDKPALKITKPVRLIELFAGIGAQAKALERLGVPFEHHKAIEIDRFAVASYNAIHGTNFQPMDITQTTADDLNITDTDKWCYILTYSFPCQDLSKAGASKGLGKGTRSGLLWEVDRILHECKELPQILLMENVSMIVSDKHINDFSVWVKRLEELGYTNLWEIMNAKDFGVPQNRERCFMVSFLGDYQFEFPKQIPLTRTMGDTLEPDVDEKYYLNEATANNLCSQLVKVERERERESRTVRCGGRASMDAKHTWDIVCVANSLESR